MLHLLQIYNMVEDKELFINLFNDLDFELNEMGWSDAPEELVSDLLDNHFGIEVLCPKQLKMITNAIINKDISYLASLP